MGVINIVIIFFTFLTVKTYIRNLISNIWNIFLEGGVDDIQLKRIEIMVMGLMEIWNMKWEKQNKALNTEVDQILKNIKKRLEQNG